MNAAELMAVLPSDNKPEIANTRAMSDDELQAYLEAKLAAHHAQRGVEL
jgi:hypothetical protein